MSRSERPSSVGSLKAPEEKNVVVDEQIKVKIFFEIITIINAKFNYQILYIF